MENKTVGFIVIAISLLVGFITWSFNRALTSIVDESCSHGPTCPMWGTIRFQTNVSIGIMVFIILLGIYLVFSDKLVPLFSPKKTHSKEDIEKIKKTLSKEEMLVLDNVSVEGTIFQSDLVEKTGMTKVKVTRILDKLEGKSLIERKRRGMTNVVILKQ